MAKRTVLVIGGGPSGLSAALGLSREGFAVRILEATSALGGRLVFPPNDHNVVIWGWQQATRALLQSLGTSQTVEREPSARFSISLPGQQVTKIRRPWFGGTLGIVFGVGAVRGLSWKDRWRVINELEKRWEHGALLAADLENRTASEWLIGLGQSAEALQRIWGPLSRFLVGQDASVSSAAAFIEAARRCFLSSWKGSRLFLPRSSAHAWFLEPAGQELERLGATIQYDSAVEHFRCDAQRVTSVQLMRGETLSADWFVAAVPAGALPGLLPERAVTRFSYFQQLGLLQPTSLLLAQFLLDRAGVAPQIRLLSEGCFHWAVIRPVDAQGTRITLVATQADALLEREDAELTRLATLEVAMTLGDLLGPSRVREGQIFRQADAFLSLRPGSATFRPLPQSPFSNLLLAGDWTDTGLPPSLESALLSGARCAQTITAKR